MRRFRGTMADRIRASYDRLERGVVYEPPAPAVAPRCQLCESDAWSDGLCTEHLIERGRAITQERARVRKLERRKTFFLAKRAARLGGDLELWSELEWRRRKGEDMPKDVSPTALWRAKWKLVHK